MVAVTLRGVEFLGKCHAASLVSVITMDESMDYSLMLLVDPVRGDTLARAAEHRRLQLPDDRSGA